MELPDPCRNASMGRATAAVLKRSAPENRPVHCENVAWSSNGWKQGAARFGVLSGCGRDIHGGMQYIYIYIYYMYIHIIHDFIVYYIEYIFWDGVKVKLCRFYTLLLGRGKAMELARQRLEAAEEARKVPSRAGELILWSFEICFNIGVFGGPDGCVKSESFGTISLFEIELYACLLIN